MPWGMRFLCFLFKVKWFVLVFACPVLCCRAQAFCHRFSAGPLSSCGARALHCGGFSYCRKQVQGHSSVVAARGRSSWWARRLRAPQWVGCSWTRCQPLPLALGRQILTTTWPGKSLKSKWFKLWPEEKFTSFIFIYIYICIFKS